MYIYAFYFLKIGLKLLNLLTYTIYEFVYESIKA